MRLLLLLSIKGLMSKMRLLGYIIIISYCFNSTIFANDILRLKVDGEATGTIDILLNKAGAPRHVERLKLLTSEKK